MRHPVTQAPERYPANLVSLKFGKQAGAAEMNESLGQNGEIQNSMSELGERERETERLLYLIRWHLRKAENSFYMK